MRLIRGVAELLLRMSIIRKLCIAVDFGDRYLRIGQGEWKAMTYNGWDLWVLPLVATARGYAKLGEYFAKMEIAIYEFYRYRLISRKFTKSMTPPHTSRKGE